MQSIKTKVEEFAKCLPNCRNFLKDFVKKGEKVINQKKRLL